MPSNELGVDKIMAGEGYLQRFVPLLKHLAIFRHQKGAQIFYCSKPIVRSNGDRYIWIYWQQLDHLICYSGDTYCLEFCKLYYDLRTGRGIYETGEQEEISSSWMITRAYANERVKECKRGDKVVVQ